MCSDYKIYPLNHSCILIVCVRCRFLPHIVCSMDTYMYMYCHSASAIKHTCTCSIVIIVTVSSMDSCFKSFVAPPRVYSNSWHHIIVLCIQLCSCMYRYVQCFAGQCPLERANGQWLNSVMVHNTKAISLYSDIDSCSFTTPARQLICKALYVSSSNNVHMQLPWNDEDTAIPLGIHVYL